MKKQILKSLLLIVSLAALLVAAQKEYPWFGRKESKHSCIHDSQAIQRSFHTGMDMMVPQKKTTTTSAVDPARRGAEIQQTSAQPIRITITTTDLFDSSKYCSSSSGTSDDMMGGTISCSSDTILTSDIRSQLIDEIIPAATTRLAQLLSVTRLTNNLIGSTTCGSHTVASTDSTTGIANSDLHIYVAGAPTTGTTAAWAGFCTRGDDGRPITGRANFSPKFNDWTNADTEGRQEMIDTAVHEILHVLGVTSTLFEGNTETATKRGKSVTMVNTARVKLAAQEFYGCSGLAGMELEDQGQSGSVGSHWERRIAYDEVMAPSSGIAVSPLSLAWLEDLGFYTPDYTKGEQMAFGRGAGCSFLDEKCNTVGGGKDSFFCFEQNSELCVLDFGAYGPCTVSTYTSDLPTYFQYFDDPKLGGSNFMDGCPVPRAYSNRDCSNNDLASVSQVRGHYYNQPDAKCFRTSGLIEDTYFLSSSKLRCLQSKCYTDADSGNKFVSVAVNGTFYNCSKNSTQYNITNIPGYKGEVECPTDPERFCDNAFPSFAPYTPFPPQAPTPAPPPTPVPPPTFADTANDDSSSSGAESMYQHKAIGTLLLVACLSLF